jgi:hypothetical protein
MSDAFFIEGTITTTGPYQSVKSRACRYDYVTFALADGGERTLNTVMAFNEIDAKIAPNFSGKFYFVNAKGGNWLTAYETNGKVVSIAPTINQFGRTPRRIWGGLTLAAIIFVLWSGSVMAELVNLTFWMPIVPGGILLAQLAGMVQVPEDLSTYRAS